MDTTPNPERPAAELPSQPAEAEVVTALTSVEGAIREFVRRDMVAPRRFPPGDGRAAERTAEFPEPGAASIEQFIQRTGGTSIREIDRLIAELKVVRDFLQAEGERVQREVANYTQVSQAALSSAKVILDSMGQWKTGSPRNPRG